MPENASRTENSRRGFLNLVLGLSALVLYRSVFGIKDGANRVQVGADPTDNSRLALTSALAPILRLQERLAQAFIQVRGRKHVGLYPIAEWSTRAHIECSVQSR
jgi:hypothetical protein